MLAAPVADGLVVVEHANAVHIVDVIVEPRREVRHAHGPVAVLALNHFVLLGHGPADTRHLDALGLGGINCELTGAVFVSLKARRGLLPFGDAAKAGSYGLSFFGGAEAHAADATVKDQ